MYVCIDNTVKLLEMAYSQWQINELLNLFVLTWLDV